MAEDRDLRRWVVLSLHRWLVRLRLLSGSRQDREPTDSPPSKGFSRATMREVSHMTIEQPENITINNSARLIKDHPGQATIENPDRVIIGDNPALIIDRPATVTIQDQKLMVIENPDEHPRTLVPIDAADESGSFIFPKSDTVSSADIERLTVE